MGDSVEKQGALDRVKVFVSYSRDDVDFAEELRLALSDKGFEPLLDIHGIDAGEKWKNRLGVLIASCDTVVFVLTETSAASPICAWEVEEAVRLAKRVLVVTPREMTGEASLSSQLTGIQWILCYRNPAVPGSSFVDGLLRLEKALRIDSDWLREQTRLMDRTSEWARNQDEARLLRGAALQEAQSWLGRAPPGTTIPSQLSAFVDASDVAERARAAEAAAHFADREAALKKAEDAVRQAEEAVKQKEIALQQLEEAIKEKEQLQLENDRLNAERAQQIEKEFEKAERRRAALRSITNLIFYPALVTYAGILILVLARDSFTNVPVLSIFASVPLSTQTFILSVATGILAVVTGFFLWVRTGSQSRLINRLKQAPEGKRAEIIQNFLTRQYRSSTRSAAILLGVTAIFALGEFGVIASLIAGLPIPFLSALDHNMLSYFGVGLGALAVTSFSLLANERTQRVRNLSMLLILQGDVQDAAQVLGLKSTNTPDAE